MARKPKLGKVEVKETVQNAFEAARGRTPTEVLIVSVLPDGTLGIDASFNNILTSHALLNRSIFEINVLQMQTLVKDEPKDA